ncbi:hypothetical protein [Actinomadura rupiterrae]|uniref:hypothetical protein n=1 Tax=Actinomadura rupiterrae TaxID=559627 RepID=UPI0020A5A3F3|nr:hypothetical protein [Actinomadura rupiterrae]MCP2340751.1 hypothetical protein [Actinomadura rupiterrae]
MRRKLILATGVIATAGAVTLGTAGMASAKASFDLHANHKTVHRHGTVGFKLAAATDSAHEHLTGAKFCLQEATGKPGKFATVKCTTVGHWDRKAKAEIYSIAFNFGNQAKGKHAFRGTVQFKHHGKWGQTYKTNSVVVTVK